MWVSLYHYTPREYFRDNPDVLSQSDGGRADRRTLPRAAERKTPHPVPSFISADVVGRSLLHYEFNPLYRYLCQTFGEEETQRLFRLYRIGTSSKWGGATIFWQTDWQGQVRTGKIMLYDPATGHRIKEPRAYVSWVHSELHLPDFRLRQCLFGEHLLNRSTSAPVMLVESEKTAVVMCHFMPDYIWLATGGKNGSFNRKAISVLRDPYLGATERWREKSALLADTCKRVIVSDMLERLATDE